MLVYRKNRYINSKIETVKNGIEFRLFGNFWWFQKGITENEARECGYNVNGVSDSGYEYTPYINGGIYYGCSDNK